MTVSHHLIIRPHSTIHATQKVLNTNTNIIIVSLNCSRYKTTVRLYKLICVHHNCQETDESYLEMSGGLIDATDKPNNIHENDPV